MGTKRLTRKEIVQEDRIHLVLATIYEWTSQYSSYLIVAGLLVVAAFVGGHFWSSYREGRSQQLQTEFADALEVYHAPVGKVVGQQVQTKYHFDSKEERDRQALGKFQDLIQKSGRGEIGTLARYYVGLVQLDLGNQKEAKEAFSGVVESGDSAEIQNLARNSLAQLAENQGDLKGAVEFYKQLLDNASLTFPQEIVLMRLGNAYEKLGDQKSAIDQYQKIVSDYPTSSEAKQAQPRLSRLQKAMDDGSDQTKAKDKEKSTGQKDTAGATR